MAKSIRTPPASTFAQQFKCIESKLNTDQISQLTRQLRQAVASLQPNTTSASKDALAVARWSIEIVQELVSTLIVRDTPDSGLVSDSCPVPSGTLQKCLSSVKKAHSPTSLDHDTFDDDEKPAKKRNVEELKRNDDESNERECPKGSVKHSRYFEKGTQFRAYKRKRSSSAQPRSVRRSLGSRSIPDHFKSGDSSTKSKATVEKKAKRRHTITSNPFFSEDVKLDEETEHQIAELKKYFDLLDEQEALKCESNCRTSKADMDKMGSSFVPGAVDEETKSAYVNYMSSSLHIGCAPYTLEEFAETYCE